MNQSGRHAKHKAIRLPPLPTELWLCIFHHATHVSGTLVPDIYDNASILGPIFIKKYHPALRKALITKRALVRVCRQWWHLAIPILYQSVYIGRVHCLYSLYSMLARSAEGKGTLGARPLGEYTQRLDIVIRDHAKDANFECELLRYLIPCMPHLAIFSVVATSNYADSDLPYSILDALESSVALRVLDWSSTKLDPPLMDRADYLFDRCTQLRVLNLPHLLWSRDFHQAVVPPTVTAFRCNNMFPFSTHGHEQLPPPGANSPRPPMPLALQELAFDFHGGDLWGDFFNLYGSQLLFVQFYHSRGFSPGIHTSLRVIAQTCPNLRRLTIVSDSFLEIVEPHHRDGPISLPTTITHLGLRIKHPNTSRADFDVLFVLLEHLRRSNMPSLRVVQLLNERTVQNLFKVHTKFAMGALHPFLEAGVPFRLEDEDGVLLTDRLKDLGCP